MAEPIVCAVMLTRDRPELAKRAVEGFRAQTYAAKRLFVLDTGQRPLEIVNDSGVYSEHYLLEGVPETIGGLRNWANTYADDQCLAGDIIVHFDDDDYSHPNRIAEQVALLQSSGADAVGYREMLFWAGDRAQIEVDPSQRGPDGIGCLGTVKSVGEAWLYSNPNPSYILGTSLCYWRRTWERKPFAATSIGEDLQFCTGLKCVGVPAVPDGNLVRFVDQTNAPRMVARIHAGNTSGAYTPEGMKRAKEWKRVPEWDAYCRSVMEK